MEIISLLSRRNILLGLAGTAVAAGGAMRFRSADEFSQLIPPRGFSQLMPPSGSGRRNIPLHTAAYEDWAVQVGTLFTANTGQVLELTDVQGFPEQSARPEGLRESAFIARFEIKRGGPLPGDQILRFAHREGGTFDMLLASGSEPLRMAAIFN